MATSFFDSFRSFYPAFTDSLKFFLSVTQRLSTSSSTFSSGLPSFTEFHQPASVPVANPSVVFAISRFVSLMITRISARSSPALPNLTEFHRFVVFIFGSAISFQWFVFTICSTISALTTNCPISESPTNVYRVFTKFPLLVVGCLLMLILKLLFFTIRLTVHFNF